MKREFLKAMGIEDENINKILDENSRDIGAEVAKTDAAKAAKATAEAAAAQRDADIAKLTGEIATLKTASQGTEALQTQLAALTLEKAEFESKLKAQTVEFAIKTALIDKAHDADIVAKLLDTTKIELDDTGKITKGLTEQLEPLQKDKAFLFKAGQQQQQRPAGWRPVDGNQQGGAGNNGGAGAKTLGEAVAAAYQQST